MLAKKIDINWHPGLSIFASEPFLKAVGDEYGWIGGFDSSGELKCILPYTIIRKAMIRMARFRVETIFQNGGISIEEEKTFLNNVIDYLKSIGADMVIPATTNTIFRTHPDGAAVAPYGTFIIDLKQPEEKLWNDIHTNHRNKIRSAIKKGVEIRIGMEYLDTAYELIRDTFMRSKIRFMSDNEFTHMFRSLGTNVKVFVAFYGDRIRGCLVAPFSTYAAYTSYSGRIPEAEPGAMNLIRWEAIRHFRELGVKRFDAVGVRLNPEKGSKQEGLFKFKQKFGGQLIKGSIWKYSINPLKYAIYNVGARLLKRGDIVDQERHKFDGI